MAQQASPNCSGQIEFLRPQLYSSCIEVTQTPCLCRSLRSCSSIWLMDSRYKSYKSHIAARKLAALQQCNSFNPFNQRVSALTLPLYTSLAPRPEEPFDEEQKKRQNRDERSHRQSSECDSKRHKKHCLNIEDQKNDRIQIILRVELNLRIAKRFDSALVRGSLVRPRFWRLKKTSP